MSMHESSVLRITKNFHEISGLRLGEVIEVFAQVYFVEKARGSRAVGIPSTPNAFAIALVADEEAFKRGVIETQSAARSQGFDRLDENKIGGARAITGRGRIRHNGKNPRFKMGRGLQPDRGRAGSGIVSAGGHRADLIEDDTVVFSGGDLGDGRHSAAQEECGRDKNSKVFFQTHARQIELERCSGNLRNTKHQSPSTRETSRSKHQKECR